MRDILIRASTEKALAKALPWLKDEGGSWIDNGNGFALAVIGKLEDLETGKIRSEAFHVVMRAIPDVIDMVPPEMIVDEPLPRGFAPEVTPRTVVDRDARSINSERDRRMAEGIDFEGHRYQTDPVSVQRIDRQRTSAMSAILIDGAKEGDFRWSNPDVDFVWIDERDERVLMDAQTMVRFGNAVVERESRMILAARKIKADPGAVNYQTGVAWPD